jgi:glycosyltransferase involved in cell wall biosynthesis
MSVLLVTQAPRAIGEFRRPWVRATNRRFVARHRRNVAHVCARLGSETEVTVGGARELIDPALLAPATAVRYYDEEIYKLDTEEMSEVTTALAEGWWPRRGTDPDLEHRGVWLPDVIAMALGVLIRLEVTEPFGALARAVREVKPARIAVMSGASVVERLARAIGEAEGLPVTAETPFFVSARLYAGTVRALFRREEKLRLQWFVDHPRRPPPPPAERAPVLFVTARARHHDIVDPLAEAARAAGIPTRALAYAAPDDALAKRIEALGRAGTPAGCVSDYVSPDEARRLISTHRPRFRRAWRRLSSEPAFARALRYRGIALEAAVRPFLRDATEVALITALLYQEAATRALDALRPRAVVVTANRRFNERAIALAARARGVPTLLATNTLLMARYRPALLDVADRVLVMGDQLRDRLIVEQGMPPERVTVLGDMRSSAARLRTRDALRAEVAATFGLQTGRPLVVLVSKYVSAAFSADEKERLYRTVHAALTRLGDLDVIVKVHPNEDLALLQRQVVGWGWPDAILAQDHDIHRLFGAADAAIMVTSMAGIEAMAMGCPVIALQPPGRDLEVGNMPPYVSAGAVEHARLDDAAALASLLRRLLDDRAARSDLVERGRRFAARYVKPADGTLAERLLAIADEARAGLETRGG